MSEKVHFFSRLLGPNDWEELPACTGDACGKLSVRGNPGPTGLRSMTVHNSGDRSVGFTIEWGTAFGCGTASSDTVFPGETFEVMCPHDYIIGYCKITANFTSSLMKNERLGASCTWKGSTYADGAVTCISDLDHRCRDGRWTALGTSESCK
jgi:hypothetical protein